jgi:D-glycero-D-manno-heptose 1,7-bisphosphate phosphatase
VQPAAFLDRDGVINLDHGYVARREEFEWVPGVREGAAQLHRAGFALVVITNQSGIGRGLYTEADFLRLTDWMSGEFAAAGAPLAGVYFCPHHPIDAVGEFRKVCGCRKPAPGMLLKAAAELSLDMGRSVVFGDKASDLQAAEAAGVPERVLLSTDGLGAFETPIPALATLSCASLSHAVVDAELARRLGLAASQPVQ